MARVSRFWRIVSGFVVVVIVLATGMVFWSSANLKRRQAVIDARMAEAGISGEFLPLKAPPLSAEGNFFNHPDLINLPLSGSIPAERRLKLETIMSGAGTLSLGEGATLGRPLDLTDTVHKMVVARMLSTKPDKGSEARAIRMFFEAAPPWPGLMHQAEVSRHAEFIPALSERPMTPLLISTPQRHLDVAGKLSKALVLHGIACSALGDFSATMMDVQALYFLTSACRREGSFISEIVAVTVEAQTMQLVWSLLTQPTLPEMELRRLRVMLDTRSYPRSLVEASLGEFAIGLQLLSRLETDPRTFQSDLGILRSVPGLLALNRCFYMETYLNHYLLPLSQNGPVAALAEAPAMAARMKTQSVRLLSFDKIFAVLCMPTTEVVLRMCIHAETQRRQALIACALEHFQRQHGKYPATLAELPEVAPVDLMTERPLGYKLTSDGRYQLWSIGLDGKDDGGHVPVTAKGTAPKFTHADYQGDWTWRYTFTP